MVYIAFMTQHTTEWEKLIKTYRLSGYHFIANDLFSASLRKELEISLKFPTCIIVGENGGILSKKAPRSSDGDKLIKTLKKKLHLKNK